MRWPLLALLLANVAAAAYLATIGRAIAPAPDLSGLELNAAQVKVLAREPAPAGVVEPPQAEPRSSAVPSAGAAACLEWGNLSAGELERARPALAKLGAPGMSVRELPDAPSWWVYIPPFKSRADADRRAEELVRQGITDVFVVADNDRWRNAISLGIFKSEDSAQAFLTTLRGRDVRAATIGQRNNLIRQSVATFIEPDRNLVARLAELRQAFPGTELRAVPCPAGVAVGK